MSGHVRYLHGDFCELVAVAAGWVAGGVSLLDDRVCGDLGGGGRVFVEGRKQGDRGDQPDLSLELRYKAGNVVSGIVLFRKCLLQTWRNG